MTLNHRFVDSNGIRMHLAEAGEGPLVILLHGFPECWYSWRRQLAALAGAGYHAVAPDLRGYGQTDRPPELEAYDIFALTGDVVGLVNALGAKDAVIVGHDWGAWIAAYLALLRRDLFRGLVLLSVPYVPRRSVNQSQWERDAYPGQVFYQSTLRKPGIDVFFQADVKASLLRAFYTLSAEAAPEERFKPARAPDSEVGLQTWPKPSWLTDQDFEVFVAEYERSGFAGGLSYYRNMDRNWELTPFLDGAKILQPTLFVSGDQDPVLEFTRKELDELEANVPNLTKKVLLPDVGHWVQQESPEQVNQLLIEFLNGLAVA